MDELKKNNKAHMKALSVIRKDRGKRSNISMIEEMIEDYLLRERGRLGSIKNNRYEG